MQNDSSPTGRLLHDMKQADELIRVAVNLLSGVVAQQDWVSKDEMVTFLSRTFPESPSFRQVLECQSQQQLFDQCCCDLDEQIKDLETFRGIIGELVGTDIPQQHS